MARGVQSTGQCRVSSDERGRTREVFGSAVSICESVVVVSVLDFHCLLLLRYDVDCVKLLADVRFVLNHYSF